MSNPTNLLSNLRAKQDFLIFANSAKNNVQNNAVPMDQNKYSMLKSYVGKSIENYFNTTDSAAFQLSNKKMSVYVGALTNEDLESFKSTIISKGYNVNITKNRMIIDANH